MNINKLLVKTTAVGIIILFFAMNVIPSTEAGNIMTEKLPYTFNIQKPTFIVIGSKGENNWYITCVLLSFIYDPEEVKEIWYNINNENWQKYQDEPIETCDDGYFHIPWYWIDHLGWRHNETTIFFKIDQTSPTIQLTRKFGLNDKVTFTANCEDDTSDVERVEFYLDDELQETYTEAPYKWIWTGTEAHMVYAIGYNYAGHSEKSNTLGTPRSFSTYYSQLISKVFQIIYHIIFWNQQIL